MKMKMKMKKVDKLPKNGQFIIIWSIGEDIYSKKLKWRNGILYKCQERFVSEDTHSVSDIHKSSIFYVVSDTGITE